MRPVPPPEERHQLSEAQGCLLAMALAAPFWVALVGLVLWAWPT